MTHHEQIRALIEAGEKANPNKWRSFRSDDYAGAKVHFGRVEGGIGLHKDMPFCDGNASFIAAAANARPALSALLDENEKQAAAINALRDALDAVMTYGGDMLPKLIQSKAQETLQRAKEFSDG